MKNYSWQVNYSKEQMAQNYRPLQTELLNMPTEVGDTLREKRERNARVCTHAQRLEQVLKDSQRRNPQIGNFAMDPANHGAPKDFNLVKARQMVKKPHLENTAANEDRALVQQRGVVRMSRAKWEEIQFEQHVVNATDAQRYANAKHARRQERAVIGRNFVPDSVDDLPECEREAILRSRENCSDRLQYEIRNTDILRDGWRLFTKERVGQILAPPFGRPGVC